MIAQLAVREPVSREAVDDAERVPELVVELRTDGSGRQGAADVVDLLAHLIPAVGHRPGRRRVLENHRDGDLAGGRIAADVIEVGGFLQLLFEAIGELAGGVVDRGARPLGLDDHGLERERRILAAPQAEIGPAPRHHDDDHHERDQGAIVDRPFGQVERRRAHDGPPTSFTFWPGRSTCTPAVTTMSPSLSPLPTIMELGS